MITLHLIYSNSVRCIFGGWRLENKDNGVTIQTYFLVTKKQSIINASRYCRMHATKLNPISLMIHRIDGSCQKNGERTYPCSVGSRSSKG